MILNDSTYGIEKLWNDLRLASALLVSGEKINNFYQGDSVVAAKAGQKIPD